MSYDKLFDKIRDSKYHLKGQIKTVSNIACEYIITSDREFFQEIASEETKRYFQEAYNNVKQKSANILSNILNGQKKYTYLCQSRYFINWLDVF